MRLDNKYNVVELYAGVARTWEAFRSWRKAKLGLLVDNDEFAVETYKQNFPKAKYVRRNLSWMSPREIQDLTDGPVDILLGCPPCQGFSDTGKRDPKDPRNYHISRYAHFVEVLQPFAVVMENVPLLANSPLFKRFVNRLDAAGYRYTAQIVNAAQYGSCQTRQRLLLVAVHKTVGVEPTIKQPTHGGTGRYYSYGQHSMVRITAHPTEFLGITPGTSRVHDIVQSSSSLGKYPIPNLERTLADLPMVGTPAATALMHTAWPSSPAMRRRMGRVPEGGRWSGGADHFSHSYGRLHRKGLARTITTFFANAGSGRFWHPTENRPLTVREAARIQGFPDDFAFSGNLSDASRLIGNALDAAIARVAATSVRRCLD